jgi:hypothetical protein
MAAVAQACERVTLSSTTGTGAAAGAASGTSAATSAASGGAGTLYDCQGRAAALAAAGARESDS